MRCSGRGSICHDVLLRYGNSLCFLAVGKLPVSLRSEKEKAKTQTYRKEFASGGLALPA
jgi:hypothetical protein